MKHRIKNFVSLIIAASMLLSLIPLTSAALDDEFEGMETLEEIPFEFELEPGDLPWEQLSTATLAASDIPACISPSLAEARGHVNRLYQQEPDDYTVMFQNRDGSKTIYVFSYPVKSTGMSMNTSAAIQVNGSAISFASGNIITSRIGVDLFDYNIGYCEIQTFYGGMLTADGVNITDDARGWARSESAAENLVYNMSGSAAAEYNMNISATANATLVPGITITPIDPTPAGGITVMSISYSALAGYMSFKNVSNNQFLTYSGSTNSLTTTIPIYTPSSIWQVTYEGSYTFRVRCLENALDTYIGLNSSSNPQLTIGLKDDSLTHTDLFLDAVAENGQVKVTILSREYGDMALSINNSFYTLGEGEDDFPTTCQWIITNKHNYALVTNLTKLSDTRIEQTGLGFEMDYTKLPATTVYENIGLYFEHNGEEVPLDPDSSEDEPVCVINEPGVYTVYYMDIATGIKSDDFTLIAVDPTTGIYTDSTAIQTFGNKTTYSIQPISDCTKYLTMTVSNSEATMISVGEYNPILHGSNIYEDWSNLSRLFTIASVSTTSPKYQITSILTKSQYDYPDESNVHTNRYDGPEYMLTYSTSKPNSLYLPIIPENLNSANVSMSLSSEGNSTLTILPIEDYYVIFATSTDSNNILNNPALKYDSNGGTTVIVEEFNPEDESFRWKINASGVDAPMIMQTQDYTCGPATFLQVLYGKGLGESVTDAQNNPTNCLHKKMMKLVNLLPYQPNPDGSYGTINTMFDDHINYYYFGNRITSQCYIRWEKAGTDNDIDYYKNKITNSLASGWAPFAHTSTGGKPYKQSAGGAHYVCIIGYEEHTVNNVTESFVIIANCHYDEDILGIYALPLDEFCQKTDILYYYEP